MATKQLIERTCDLCGSQVEHDLEKHPIGWRVIQVTVGDRDDTVQLRDICPFCWEQIERLGTLDTKGGAR